MNNTQTLGRRDFLQVGPVLHEVEQLKASIAHLKIAADQPLEQSDYFAELFNWQTRPGGATATIVEPLHCSLETFIKDSPYAIEMTPISLEDWYLEVSNECV